MFKLNNSPYFDCMHFIKMIQNILHDLVNCQMKVHIIYVSERSFTFIFRIDIENSDINFFLVRKRSFLLHKSHLCLQMLRVWTIELMYLKSQSQIKHINSIFTFQIACQKDQIISHSKNQCLLSSIPKIDLHIKA